MNLPRLDLLIYAHDGRGLGHAGRSIAIGMAMRRLFPDKRVLFVSGTRHAQTLIGNAPLDWIKLPAYATRVIDGRSTGVDGLSNLSDRHLGIYRADTLAHLIRRYRPRCVLADHSPQGKHKELLPAIDASKGADTCWVLGIRGVVGSVAQVGSRFARETFRHHYSSLFWYGDSHVLGAQKKDELQGHFQVQPIETGYVSRLSEFIHRHSNESGMNESPAATVSIPWIGEQTEVFLSALAEIVSDIATEHGPWHIYLGNDSGGICSKAPHKFFSRIPYCRVMPVSDNYAASLMASKIAVIYGGYNSLMDVLWTGKPALVILRDMRDQEQEHHLRRLTCIDRVQLKVMTEKSSADNGKLRDILSNLLRTQAAHPGKAALNMDGAAQSAIQLNKFIEQNSL